MTKSAQISKLKNQVLELEIKLKENDKIIEKLSYLFANMVIEQETNLTPKQPEKRDDT